MAKKMTEQNEAEMVEAVEAVEVNESTSNLVTLQTGEVVDFGKNGKIISSYDVETGEVTFKCATGEVLTINANELPEAVKAEAVIYGVAAKIKATLSPISVDKVAEKIQKEIAALQAGSFVTRGTSATLELDNFMKAFAFVNATGVVKTNNEGGSFDVPAVGLAVAEFKPHWVDVKDAAVIAEVLAFWDTLDRKEKAAQKRNTFVTTQAGLIEAGIVAI